MGVSAPSLHRESTYSLIHTCSSDLPVSKHKARYCPNPERATYIKKSRKHSAKAATAARWQNEKQDPPQSPLIPGYRIMNMGELSKSIEKLTSHSTKCGGACSLQGKTHA